MYAAAGSSGGGGGVNNINGSSGGRRQVLSSVDFYRRVPKDLTEATTLGAIMSVLAMSMMIILFLSETNAFLRTKLITNIEVDDTSDTQIRLNFNITMLDLHCDYVSVDVWDALGTNKQNITKNVDKWQLDEYGTKRVFSGRNRETREIQHDTNVVVYPLISEHGEPIEAVVRLTKDTFESFLKEHEMAFIDLYAPWCVWCQRLEPIWEKFAQEAKESRMPIGVGKVDCVAEADLCREAKVVAFPTLRWYHAGEPVSPDYKMDRTVAALVGFASRKLEMDDKFKEWATKNADTVTDEDKEAKRKLYHQDRPEHPSCLVSGHLMVNRVPGNFHIEASSKSHNLNAAMTNLSHVVHHLSFGDPKVTEERTNRNTMRTLKSVPEEHKQFFSMNGLTFNTMDYHQAYHHYIKVVSTKFNLGTEKNKQISAYQYIQQSQIVFYEEQMVPEARFSYDLSPMSVVVEKRSRHWYDYLTSLCAIIGGTFTTLGLIDATLYKILKPKKL